jgi:hypothetical protein
MAEFEFMVYYFNVIRKDGKKELWSRWIEKDVNETLHVFIDNVEDFIKFIIESEASCLHGAKDVKIIMLHSREEFDLQKNNSHVYNFLGGV